MSGVVIDASVAMAWFLRERVDERMASLFGRIAADGALVPVLWPIEIANALLVAERCKRLDTAARHRAIADLRRLAFEIDDQTANRAWDATYALAERFRLSLYDACYLELAQRSGLPLASLDRDLRAAAAALGIAVLPEG